jgi:hypothetical protein
MVFIMLRNGEGPLDPVPEAALIHQSAKPSAPKWAILANLRRSTQEDLECRMMSSCPCGLAAIASPRVADLISLGEPANGSISSSRRASICAVMLTLSDGLTVVRKLGCALRLYYRRVVRE